MTPEKDAYLVEKFPKMFVERYLDPTQTCMCWGFEIGDGWFDIVHNTCSLIQSHVDWKRKQRALALRYNRALNKALKGDLSSLTKYLSRGVHSTLENDKWVKERVEAALVDGLRKVPDACTQVVVEQVKEKFGTLRFYYRGGDEYVSGIVSMAEAMTAITCEECGKPGVRTNGGWIKVRCEEHTKE